MHRPDILTFDHNSVPLYLDSYLVISWVMIGDHCHQDLRIWNYWSQLSWVAQSDHTTVRIRGLSPVSRQIYRTWLLA